MVPKPGDPKPLRLVVDYRQLNQQTVRDRYPLPDIQLMFDEMQGAAFFSSFDAVDGLWQVPMAEEDVEKTAFTTQMGAYEWLVMPQRLQNSPSQYQRRMQRALGHLPFVRIFIDDVVVFSRTVEEHHDHVRQFLDTCREKGVYLKASKAQMLKESLRFLGHTLSAEGCQPQHDKVSSIKDWPKLETVTYVRQFLGLAGYYRRFVHRFSEIAQPLTSLTKTDVPWQWGELQQWAFDELKTALSSSPVLALPDMKAAADGSAPFLVQTDASGVPLGGVLMQDTGDGMRGIAYDSRQFSAAEQNYHTGERELYALHHCTTVTWRHYLVSSDFRLQGLKEAGVVDKETDLPKDPLSVLDVDEIFEDHPPPPVPGWVATMESWMDGVETLQPAQPSGRAAKPPADRQDWKVRKEVFERLQRQFGSFDVDACCDLGGRNRQVDAYWTDCLQQQWRGKHVWCNPPYSSSHISIEAVLRKYVDEWRQDPAHTSAVFLLPDIQARMPQWRRLFRMAGMRLVEVIPTHDERGMPTQLFETPDGVLHDLPWPVLVVHAPPTRQLVPRVRHPRVAPPIVRQGKAAKTRDATSLPTDVTFLESLHDEYARAGPLRQLRDEILAAPHHATRDFRIVGDVLWRVAAGRYQLVLGEDSPLREAVFKDAHDSTAAGHTGREKTLERVLRRFWWKNASEDVAGWVASCPTCQAVRPRASYPDGLLNPHAIPQRNWQDVSVDFVTGLPLTAQGNDAFVTFTCKLSKMVHLMPMNFGDSSAQTVARIYFDVVWRQHGAPMKIVCDRDPRFQDSFWRELMRLMGVRVASTTPYNPRSDGQAEHTNRVVEDMLRSFVGANPDDWDLYMTNVEFAINDSRSDVTGFTPFELCYGVSPMSQLDLFLEAAALPGSARRKGGVGTAHEMAAKFSSQLRDARGRLELAQQRQREQFDRRHKQHKYAVGDLVWIEARHLTEKVMDRALCRKLDKRWHGPVPVVECFYSDLQAELAEADRGAPVAYRLALPPRWRIHDVFAQHRLKPCVSGMDEFASRAQLPVPDPVMVDGQAEAHVDKILAYRVRMVKEVDSPPKDFCLPWERVETLGNGELVVITDLEERKTRPVRILVLFSGTRSVEREFAKCFPSASVVTLDNDPRWQPNHLASMEDWDPTQYPPGFFDVIWASPPCTQYSQARTTGGPPDLEGADKSVKCTLDAIEYLKPKDWFLENPEGRYPNALRLRNQGREMLTPCTPYRLRYCVISSTIFGPGSLIPEDTGSGIGR
ncbi:hypothetical protein CYMTET_8584 [Cymbomonas tetramitiformis]|uniref:Uncharacterized protein n=1 Tax=Cymbomonas tetramitiformis TaxID=36881 RepID=A0AAE0GST4_9CHLO|nr:hypothetical protein CYMTET_8584 [Cymbomonas tetramitiformis]